MCDFVHLHSHTQFSLLDGAADINKMIAKAKNDGMVAAAITDHGNMFGAFNFFSACKKHNIKPILGCEVYVVEDRFNKKFTRENKDKRYHQLLLAKNAKGYQNLMKIVSTGFIDGLYQDFPRVDKSIIKQYAEGIIATTCCVGAEVPQTIMHKGEAEAEKVFLEWLDIFGEDYYIELQRHHIENLDNTGWSQEAINQVLLKFAQKHSVKVIATNDSHYVDQQDSEAHDILLCMQTGKDITDENRFKFPNDNFFFKTQNQMKELFKDVPFAIENTLDIVEKVQSLDLKRDILLPAFKVPENFNNDQNEYLKYLTFEGARKRWGEILPIDIIERLDFELQTIKGMGFPGYFLIVQDFINAGKKLGVFIGPGRGSAAGSAVAYAIGITNVDPIKYNLLFERFLNPDRISMPDMDIDFDDAGRQKVIDYVIDKYRKNQVAQIVTYSTMAARSSIRDVGRVLKVPLSETDKLAKLVPDGVKVSLETAFKEVAELKTIKENKEDLRGRMLRMAEQLEGTVRNKGIHAAGVIIAPDDITNFVPVCTAKDSDLLVTQFDGSVVENAGMLKMDFLGLRTLTILKDALANIKKYHNVEIDLDTLPLDDEKTYQLFQNGETIGIFQFESAGMQKHLKDLKPDSFEDLIAMNALYRPGPMEYIPNFIKRKHGKEEIAYDLPDMEEFLQDTYGITVYQEQVMLLSQKLAGFTKGKADELRKAMGKKIKEKLDELKPLFLEGCSKNNHPQKVAEKVWKDWEAFASYAFNKSHSTCYALVAYQTAYLKAHYPASYMAAVLSHNMSDIKQVYLFMNECKRMGINTLEPDINESDVNFAVNKEGDVRFALSAIKGVGEAAVEEIVKERDENGAFVDIFDFTKRVNLRAVNKKSMEMMAQAGAFDSFGNAHRAQYFHTYSDGIGFIEKAIKFGNSYKDSKEQNAFSLFGEDIDQYIPPPEIPHESPWSNFEKLQNEKEVIGIYLSGHPLDDYQVELKSCTNATIQKINELNSKEFVDREFRFAALVTSVAIRKDKKDRPWASVKLEDFDSSIEIRLFGDDYTKYLAFLENGYQLLINAAYQLRFKDQENPDLVIRNIMFMHDVMEKKGKALSILIHYKNITPDLIENLKDIFTEHQGKKPVSIYIANNSGDNLILKSKKYTVSFKKELFDELQTINDIYYKVEFMQ